MKAARILLEQIQDFSQKRMDFAFETTLSGKTYLSLLKDLKKKGYSVHLFFLWVPSVDLALARIRERVSKGGHNVPVQDVRRRFRRSINNLFQFYRPLLNSWVLFDNSMEIPRPIAEEKYGELVISDKNLFSKIYQKEL
jgi:predicted ABC-type ATPase